MNQFSVASPKTSDSSNAGPYIKLIAVHLGASNKNSSCSDKQKNLASRVCETVMNEASLALNKQATAQTCNLQSLPFETLSQKTSECYTAETAVVRAVELMENDSHLNCGFGSNLNIFGQVECDASLMSGRDEIWAGVGAVSCCRNPIRLAQSLHDHSVLARPLGLVQPNLLVASGAKHWMREHCSHLIIHDSHLISANGLAKYQEFKSRYDEAEKNPIISGNSCVLEEDNLSAKHQKLDTVGAIAVDSNNDFACAISSGGIVLKHRGRVGQAAVPGAGCWAQNSLAVTTTGVGEYLTTTLFAKKIHDKLHTLKLIHDLGQPDKHEPSEQGLDKMLNEAIRQSFRDLLNSPALEHAPLSERLAGLIAVSSHTTNLTNHRLKRSERSVNEMRTHDNENDFYLSYGYNTKSLCIGYMLAHDLKAVSFVSCSRDSNNQKNDSDCASQIAGVFVETLRLKGKAENMKTEYKPD